MQTTTNNIAKADAGRNSAIESLATLSAAIKAARLATGKSAVCTAAQWEAFNVASAALLNEVAFLAQTISPEPPIYGPFVASPEEFQLITAA